MKKNDIVRVIITSLTGQGDGVAKHESGITLFVPNAAIGDVLDVKILKLKKSYGYAKIENIVNASNDRIDSDCKSSVKCGGCVFRHISYDSELKIKRQTVVDALQRIAKFDDIYVNDVVRSKLIERYRNKAILPITKSKDGSIDVGFFVKNTHRVVGSDDCLLHPKEFKSIVDVLKLWIEKHNISIYDETTGLGILRNIYIRMATSTGEIMVCLVVNSNDLPFKNEFVNLLLKNVKQVKSVMLNINKENTNVVLGERSKLVYGKDHITDILCGLSFDISLHSFYQVNKLQTEKLYSIVGNCANLSHNDVLLDLYCGIGTIGLSLAHSVKKVIGVDIVEQSIENAKSNAVKNKIQNAEFILADASDAVKKIKQRKEKIDVVVLDPPRKGCSVDVINTIVEFGANRIVYVSCNPATLSRDLKVFHEKNYCTTKVFPVDMFPRTGHVETVVLMSQL